MLSSGQLLAERYKLTNRIAVGGMGEVWQASDTRLDRVVAVKVLKAELSGDAEFLHRFRTEARMTASLNHPGIAAVHDYGETIEPGTQPEEGNAAGAHHVAYLVMEFVEGDPLAGILAREGRISPERTLDILEQAAYGLQAAHERGLVHRDIKPGNILVTPTGQVKITDFGIAKAADAAPVTRNGMVMGTAHYIAPEQALGQNAEPASDVYSLAVCGYECLTGHRPFLSENAVTVAMMHIRDLPPPLPPDVPPGVRAVIEATLIKDPRQRYNNGGEFAAAVAAVRAGLPLPTPSGLLQIAYAPMQSGPIGPGSHPMMHPVPPPGLHPHQQHLMPQPHPARPQRSSHVFWWLALAMILVALVVAVALVIVKLVGHGGSGSPPKEPPGGGPALTAAPTVGPPDQLIPGGTESEGPQGMMTTPWTEWNGTQK
jgi:serine/threonine protein kinase